MQLIQNQEQQMKNHQLQMKKLELELKRQRQEAQNSRILQNRIQLPPRVPTQKSTPRSNAGQSNRSVKSTATTANSIINDQLVDILKQQNVTNQNLQACLKNGRETKSDGSQHQKMSLTVPNLECNNAVNYRKQKKQWSSFDGRRGKRAQR